MDQVKMTPEEAHERLLAGAFVLCLDVPAETEFGVDIMSWNGAILLVPHGRLLFSLISVCGEVMDCVYFHGPGKIVQRFQCIQ